MKRSSTPQVVYTQAPVTPVSPPPPVPTLDAAAMSDENTKKIGRRKGRAALRTTGGGLTQPSVALRQALG